MNSKLGILLIASGALLLVISLITMAQNSTSPLGNVAPPTDELAALTTPQAQDTPTESATQLATDPSRAFAEQTIAAFKTAGPPTLAPIATFAPTLTPAAPNDSSVQSNAAAPIIAPRGSLSRTARVIIPAINVNAPVVEMGWKTTVQDGQEVTDWDLPSDEVGHSINSVEAGEAGNVVLSAHNNIYTALFRKLYTLKPGQDVTLVNASGQKFSYEVSQSYIVKEAGATAAEQLVNAQVLLPTRDARLTLISCWPETSNTHRVIVIAKLIGQTP